MRINSNLLNNNDNNINNNNNNNNNKYLNSNAIKVHAQPMTDRQMGKNKYISKKKLKNTYPIHTYFISVL